MNDRTPLLDSIQSSLVLPQRHHDNKPLCLVMDRRRRRCCSNYDKNTVKIVFSIRLTLSTRHVATESAVSRITDTHPHAHTNTHEKPSDQCHNNSIHTQH